MLKYSIVIMTVNRAENYRFMSTGKRDTNAVNYIHATLENMWRSRVFDYPNTVVNLMESGSNDMSYLKFIEESDGKYPVNVVPSKDRLLLPQNYMRSLIYGSREAEYVILMEDDIDLVPNFMEQVDKFVNKYNNQVMWSMHTPYKEIVQTAKGGKDMSVGTGKNIKAGSALI